jgi:hypothetical protein
LLLGCFLINTSGKAILFCGKFIGGCLQKKTALAGLGFVYLSFACGSVLSAIEEFMVPKQIETFLRRSGHCPWRLDLETDHKAR